MVMFLSLLLLAQLFTPVQAPPVEVLNLKVERYDLSRNKIRDPDDPMPPPGPVYAENVPGVRTKTDIRAQRPTIEDRSTELRKVATRPALESVIAQSTRGYVYQYKLRVKNTSPKNVKAILWEYQLADDSANKRLFVCAVPVKPGNDKQLYAKTFSPPSRVVSANSDDKSQKGAAVINWVEYTDGTTWTRDGWKQQDTDTAINGRSFVTGQCTAL